MLQNIRCVCIRIMQYVYKHAKRVTSCMLLVAERNQALTGDDTGGQHWTKKTRSASFYKNMGNFCCICRPNYL